MGGKGSSSSSSSGGGGGGGGGGGKDGRPYQELGVALERIEFRGPSGLTDMMAEYADVDIALDPAPYNGGTTSLQAMWMGAPVLTMAGGHFVSRMGASFMQAAGLPEWVASDDADLVRRAVAWSKNRKDLLALKQGLRQRLSASPAWDIDAYTRDMQSAIRQMWIASSLRGAVIARSEATKQTDHSNSLQNQAPLTYLKQKAF
jgi:glycosyltransferase involved in cell wall biosynthesis